MFKSSSRLQLEIADGFLTFVAGDSWELSERGVFALDFIQPGTSGEF